VHLLAIVTSGPLHAVAQPPRQNQASICRDIYWYATCSTPTVIVALIVACRYCRAGTPSQNYCLLPTFPKTGAYAQVSTAGPWPIIMDGYGHTQSGRNFYSFNVLLPSYHQDQQFICDDVLDNGFGFDPSPKEQSMVEQDPATGDLLYASTFQLPCQSSPAPACLLQQSIDQVLGSRGQKSSQNILSPATSAGGATAASQYKDVKLSQPNSAEAAIRRGSGDATRPANDSTINRRRDKSEVIRASVPCKLGNDTGKPSKKRGRRPSSASQSSQSSLGADKHKEVSLEKNRVAAAKCRVKKKEKDEQMLQDSRLKAKENKELHDMVREMEVEMDTLATFLAAHSDSSNCRKSDQLKETLRQFQRPNMARWFSGSLDSPSSVHSPVLSLSDHSPSSTSNSRSPATPSEYATQALRLDSYIVGDMDIDSPPFSSVFGAPGRHACLPRYSC
jgi:hypothetical protein